MIQFIRPKELYMDKQRNLIPNQLNIDESNIDEWSRGKIQL